MLQKPNTVFVCKKVNTTGDSFVVGDLVAINAATGAVVATATITNAASAPARIQLGYVKSVGATDADANIVKTQDIAREQVVNSIFKAYVAKREAVSTFDLTGVTLIAGARYVIRIVYKDLYEHPGQFTHTYEVVNNGLTINTLGAAFVAKINAHKGTRVVASYVDATGILTLTAKAVDGPEPGIATKEALSPYTQVSMVATMYYTKAEGLAYAAPTAIAGLVSTNVDSIPGKGNPFVVRDREQAALAYKGITYRMEWPNVKPELNVDLSKTYDSFNIEFAKKYQSPDNQYVKSTDLAAEFYVEAGAGLAALATAVQGWASLVGPQGETGPAGE